MKSWLDRKRNKRILYRPLKRWILLTQQSPFHGSLVTPTPQAINCVRIEVAEELWRLS